MAGELLRQSFEHLACLAAVLRQHCVSCGCRTSFRQRKQIAKKMNVSKIRCGSLATLFFARQSCGVVHNTMRLPYETKKFVVADRCTAAARLMGNRHKRKAKIFTQCFKISIRFSQFDRFARYFFPKSRALGPRF